MRKRPALLFIALIVVGGVVGAAGMIAVGPQSDAAFVVACLDVIVFSAIGHVLFYRPSETQRRRPIG